MEEYSLSFLTKDRYLDAPKRQWIQEHVRKRECAQFLTVEEAKFELDHPRMHLAHSLGTNSEADKALCRCGREYRHHWEQSPQNTRSRDYRLFSTDVPTDVFLEIVHSKLSKTQPISYSPKQVIRLAADTDPSVLRHLIGQIWHVPKASFLVSLYGSCEGVDSERNLPVSANLHSLLHVLSNPGSALVTVSLSDSDLYQKVMQACDTTRTQQLPFAEITPVAFVPWTSLTSTQKGLLIDLTQQGGSTEHQDIIGKIRTLDVMKKGYFLLADYGVYTDLNSVTLEPADDDAKKEEFLNTLQPTVHHHASDPNEVPDEHHVFKAATGVPEGGSEEESKEQTSAQTMHGERSPLLEGGDKVLSREHSVRHTGQMDEPQQYPTTPTATGYKTDRERADVDVKKYQFFSYSFPHPLRGRVETLLNGHTHDPDGHGSLMILFGSTSFVDLAAAHGAIRSGVPVIFDKHGIGATALLLEVMKDVDQKTDKGTADLVSDKRHFIASDEELKKAIKRHQSKLTDYFRYEGQVFRVIRDILNNRHLVTLHDFSSSSSLVEAAVEAFIKARPDEEEAVIFFKKNTMRLAAEEYHHPVKQAQREFQAATIKVATKLNRPELLDVIVDYGFMSDFEVFPTHEYPCLSPQEREKIQPDDSIPYSKIKDLHCFGERECFVQHVCKLKNVDDLVHSKPSTIVHHLFLYAVLNGQTRLAKHFWKQAVFQDHVAHALVASHVSNHLAENVPGDRQAHVFKLQADEFKNLAKGTVNDCYLHDPKKACDIITGTAEAFGLSPIEAAASFQMRSFVALPAASDYLDCVWKGEDTPSSSQGDGQTGCRHKFSQLLKLFTTPRGVCFTSTVFYLIFLVLYGHVIIFQPGRGSLSPLDITVIVWTLSFLVEEIVQCLEPKGFLLSRTSNQPTFKTKLSIYFSDTWNILDVVSVAIFALGYTLRLAVPWSEAGHVVLSLVYVLFVLRLLRVLTVSRSIGPMLPMIWNMLGDLVPFLVILFIFVFAYGLASEALLHPGTSWHGLYLLYLPRVAFWPIFGEYGLETIDDIGVLFIPERALRHSFTAVEMQVVAPFWW
ncbi:uncharacterized protein LOC143289823 isoform X2 [Babylonia areolata]|uniref:uncharacterized protein LOC143289823 isoform X2 n=1 Tax=Babylonia areolata TaxID=304850 RepID=UPI003FD53FD9